MAYQALYRKYRPQTFSEVYGQDHIVETLKGELEAGKISHAYLFTGTRGTGKTTCARILAKAVNCENSKGGNPCLTCDACRMISEEEATDIVELDAASNNGIDDIRILRDQVSFLPTTLKYRVYIIDEVHMLSNQAFNALLKTLEEPPAHAIFILATTEVHKLPATVLSRCQRFDFKRIDSDKIVARINFIAKEEGFTITPLAAELIAAACDGGMRDALSILDLCVSVSNNITETVVTDVCGMSGNDYLNRLSDAIISGNSGEALTLIDELHKGSVDMLRLANDLCSHFRDIMIVKAVSTGKKPIVCSSAQLEIYEKKAAAFNMKDVLRALDMLSVCVSSMQTGNRRSIMEMTILRLCSPELCEDYASLEKRVRALEGGAISRPVKAEVAPKADEKPVITKKAEKAVVAPEAPTPDEDIPDIAETEPPVDDTAENGECEAWGEMLKILAKTCPPIRGVLDNSKAYIEGAYLLIDAPNPMFRNFINGNSSVYRDAIRNAATKVLGKTYKLGPYRAPVKEAVADPLKEIAEKIKQYNIPEGE